MVKCEFLLNEYSYCIYNVYGPNEDDEKYFKNIVNKVKSDTAVHTIIGGDFNVIRDPEVDRHSKMVYHPCSKRVLDDLVENEGFVDIWQTSNPDKKYFTWMKHHARNTWSRIDYFLVSASSVTKCVECNILANVTSDHSLVTLDIDIAVTKRGPGVWKLNDELLSDTEFVDHLKSCIETLCKCYAFMDSLERWEIIKSEIRYQCRERSKHLAHLRKLENYGLYVKLASVQERMLENYNANAAALAHQTAEDLKSFEIQDAKRAAFRCRQTWTQHGERSSRYYFNLEKRNFMSKTMYIVKKPDGSITKNYSEILNLQYSFYKDLYTLDEKVHFGLVNESGIILDQGYKTQFEETITMEECFDALMTLKSGKTSGSDGLGLELYRKCWKVLKVPLYQMYMTALQAGTLNPTARRGIINLTPKKGKDNLLIKNWHPITLLNYDYKIWAKAVANRLESVADKLIGNQQSGFMKGRSIFSNIRKTVEIVRYLHRVGEPGLVVQIDFEKCFDRIEHKSIAGAMRYFGFGELFIKMLMLLYSKLEMCTVSNGWLSDWFVKSRGSNQGCPASPLVFRWFKFTLKPPNRIGRGKLRLAIWDTSFWTFLVKFGHNGP